MGAGQYFQQHQSEVPDMSLVMESDMGSVAQSGRGTQARKAKERQCNPSAQPIARDSRFSLLSLFVLSPPRSVFHPTGLQFTGSAAANTVLSQIAPLLASINATNIVGGGDGTDIAPWMAAGVPGASLDNDNERYFW